MNPHKNRLDFFTLLLMFVHGKKGIWAIINDPTSYFQTLLERNLCKLIVKMSVRSYSHGCEYRGIREKTYQFL